MRVAILWIKSSLEAAQVEKKLVERTLALVGQGGRCRSDGANEFKTEALLNDSVCLNTPDMELAEGRRQWVVTCIVPCTRRRRLDVEELFDVNGKASVRWRRL